MKHPFSRGPREGAYTPLYSFQGYPIDAGGPNQLFAWNGELIGTSYNGGIASSDPSKDCQCGTVFVALGESEDVNYTFPGPTGAGYASTGANPDSGLILARDKLWGTAQYGGDYGLGTVFNIDSDGNVALAYAFDDQGDAANPTSTLYFSKDALYGTGMHGGTTGDGAVFVLDYGKDKETPLYSFKGSDGLFPQTGLTPLPGTHLKNALFGVAGHGGANGFGAVYEINETGTIEATLYSFKGEGTARIPRASSRTTENYTELRPAAAPDARPMGVAAPSSRSTQPARKPCCIASPAARRRRGTRGRARRIPRSPLRNDGARRKSKHRHGLRVRTGNQ